MTYLDPMSEYLRPAKLFTLSLGLIFLVAGAQYFDLPDWDIPVSFLMAFFAYLTAAPTVRVLVERRWEYAHYALFWTWFTVDGSYVVYWSTVNPEIVAVLRPANAAASLVLYLLCGAVWHLQTTRYRVMPSSLY